MNDKDTIELFKIVKVSEDDHTEVYFYYRGELIDSISEYGFNEKEAEEKIFKYLTTNLFFTI